MSIFTDFNETYGGRRFPYQIKEWLTSDNWLSIMKWRRQRINRGWSDRDTWGAGEHIALMTAQMLHRLNTETFTDWPEWFKWNVKETRNGAYTSLQEVIDDINNYLENQETSWADGLHTAPGNFSYKEGFSRWVDDQDHLLSKEEIQDRINKWHKKDTMLHKKATKAMTFFARHFMQFWD